MITDSQQSAIAESDSLAALASQINEQHSQATQHATTAIEHARQAGALLQQAKQQVGHGDWLAWLAANCSVSPRQAQRYLKVANNWQAITKNDATSYLTIDEAIESTKPEPDVAVDNINDNKATTVVNVKTDSFDIYIGRENKRRGYPASKWANPFVVGRDGNRNEVIAKYVAWFPQQPELVASVYEIRGKRLGCWCHPLPCHGDFLAELADKAPAKPPSKNDAASYLTIDEAIESTKQSDKPLVEATEDKPVVAAVKSSEIVVAAPNQPVQKRLTKQQADEKRKGTSNASDGIDIKTENLCLLGRTGKRLTCLSEQVSNLSSEIEALRKQSPKRFKDQFVELNKELFEAESLLDSAAGEIEDIIAKIGGAA